MTNGDKIRTMSDEELADVMQGQCTCCAYRLNRCADKECKDGVYEWLKQEENDNEQDSKAGCHLREILNRIEQDVRRGLWFDHKHTDTVVCSECGHVFTDETPYCPHCGVKMNRGTDND